MLGIAVAGPASREQRPLRLAEVPPQEFTCSAASSAGVTPSRQRTIRGVRVAIKECRSHLCQMAPVPSHLEVGECPCGMEAATAHGPVHTIGSVYMALRHMNGTRFTSSLLNMKESAPPHRSPGLPSPTHEPGLIGSEGLRLR